jgi:hypothetical protein
MADFTRVKYGQVEPNQLSAQKTGQIYASLPLDSTVTTLQNGEFMYYDEAAGKVSADDSTGVAEPMLVFNEIKLYEPFWRTSYKDFAMIRVGDNYVTTDLATAGYGDGALNQGVAANPAHPDYGYRMDGIAPRLFKTNVGDIYTTNMVKIGTGIEYSVGDKLVPVKDTNSKTLVLETDNTATTGMIWVVVKVYTMPDGQPGLKLQRVH